jgi:uncharacterized protein
MIWAALILGLGSSLHCMGMCGPLVAAMLPFSDRLVLLKQNLVYHAGRIFTYGMLGLIAGSFGFGLHLAGIQQALAFVGGAILILAAIFPFAIEKGLYLFTPIKWLVGFVQKHLGGAQKLPTVLRGMLHGLLPCGMVYLAMAAALSAGTPEMGAVFMLVFGLGTLPSLFIFSLGSGAIFKSHRNWLKYGQAALLVLSGALLIWKGLRIDPTAISWSNGMPTYDCH